MVVDLFLIYSFLKRLVSPFSEWDAFRTGVIDSDGNILIKKENRSDIQKKSFQKFDLMIMKLKRLLAKLPGGSTRLASFAAALWLIKEGEEFIESGNELNEEVVETLYSYMESLQRNVSVNTRFELFEELTTSSDANLGQTYVDMGADYSKNKKMLKRKKPSVTKEALDYGKYSPSPSGADGYKPGGTSDIPATIGAGKKIRTDKKTTTTQTANNQTQSSSTANTNPTTTK